MDEKNSTEEASMNSNMWARPVSAKLVVTLDDGTVWDIALKSAPERDLTCQIDVDRPPRELTFEETDFSPFRQYVAGLVSFVDVKLSGVMDTFTRTLPAERPQ